LVAEYNACRGNKTRKVKAVTSRLHAKHLNCT
jgi:hypothetical protein